MMASSEAGGNGSGSNNDSNAAVGANLIVEMQDVLSHIPDAISLYKTELEKLLTAFTKSQESEQRLLHRTKEILHEIHSSHDAMLRDQEEENEAAVQKKTAKLELDAVHEQITAARHMEADKQQKLNDLRSTLALLQEDVSKLSLPNPSSTTGGTNDMVLTDEQELQIASMKRQRAEYAHDVEVKATTLQDLRRETTNLYALVADEETRNAQLEDAQTRTRDAIRDKQTLTADAARRKTALERELKTHKQTLECLQLDVAAKDALRSEHDDAMRRKELVLRESKLKMETYLKQYDALFRTTHSLTEAMQAQWTRNVELDKDNARVEHELHVREAAVASIVRDAHKLEQRVVLAREQIIDVDAKRAASDADRDATARALDDLVNGAVEVETKQRELLARKLDDMLREREVLNRMLVKASDRAHATFDLLKIKENTKTNLENEASGLAAQVKRARAQIQVLVADRERYERDAAAATTMFVTALEAAKVQDLQVASLQHKIVESARRLKQQQSLYEAVRTDRNSYSKQLVEAQDAIGDLKRRFKVLTHAIAQLQEEITRKDHALVHEHFAHHKVDKEREMLRHELVRIRKQIASSEQILANQALEATKLTHILRDADDETTRQRKELASVVHDRDTLRQQLIARTGELDTLYEKLKLQRATLDKGRSIYKAKQREAVALELRLSCLKREHDASASQLAHEDGLQRERVRLETALRDEQAKIRALSDELEHPLNVHRWRALETSDPKRFELLRRLQTLQRRLIRACEDATVKDLLILEKEKLYVELQTILARQPGAEVAEQLAVYKDTLKAKHTQLRSMHDELALYKLQVQAYRRDLEQLAREKQRVQTDWLDAQLRRMTNQDDGTAVESNHQFAAAAADGNNLAFAIVDPAE